MHPDIHPDTLAAQALGWTDEATRAVIPPLHVSTTYLRDADVCVRSLGRDDDIIISAGYRIGPAEIESCLVRHPAVANAAVIGKPDATRGAIVKAFIVLQPGESPSAALEDEIRAHVARPPRALRVPEGNRVHRRAADDQHRQGPAPRAAIAGGGARESREPAMTVGS